MREHLAKDIPVEALATLVELRPFHFSRVFKRTTGMSLLQFVMRRSSAKPRAPSSRSRSKSATRARAILLKSSVAWLA